MEIIHADKGERKGSEAKGSELAKAERWTKVPSVHAAVWMLLPWIKDSSQTAKKIKGLKLRN